MTVTCPLPEVPLTPVGALGTVDGVTALDAVEADPAPVALLALTVKVYAVPLVSPVTVQVVAGAVAVQVYPAALEETV